MTVEIVSRILSVRGGVRLGYLTGTTVTAKDLMVEPNPPRFVREGDVIEAGSLTFDVLETPGHTPGGITYRCEDCLFTGDTLFRMSCGRYDFPGSSSLDLGHSLEKLRDLPGDYEVYPGHEGSTSLEYERRFNPYMLRPWDL